MQPTMCDHNGNKLLVFNHKDSENKDSVYFFDLLKNKEVATLTDAHAFVNLSSNPDPLNQELQKQANITWIYEKSVYQKVAVFDFSDDT